MTEDKEELCVTGYDNLFRSLHSQGIGIVCEQAGLLAFGSWGFCALRHPCHCWMQFSCLMASILCWGEGKSTVGSSCQFALGEMEDPADPASKLAFLVWAWIKEQSCWLKTAKPWQQKHHTICLKGFSIVLSLHSFPEIHLQTATNSYTEGLVLLEAQMFHHTGCGTMMCL